MQTFTLDEEIKLIDGVLHDINFSQDFARVCLNGQPIAEIATESIINFIKISDRLGSHVGVNIFDVSNYIPDTAETVQFRKNLFKQASKTARKEAEREERWKRNKRNRQLDAEELWDEIESGEYFLKGRNKKSEAH